MEKKIDLVEILKKCPKGTKLYSCIHGEVEFCGIDSDVLYPIIVKTQIKDNQSFTSYGHYHADYDGECVLFPSKDNRDWSTFVVPKKKKVERFDPKTLKPFDKILVRDKGYKWLPRFFAILISDRWVSRPIIDTTGTRFEHAIPYEGNEELYLTANEPDEFYRYWED